MPTMVVKSVVCDCGCGEEVSYRGIEKDIEAEEWYAENWHSTGAKSYQPKFWFVNRDHERRFQDAELGAPKGGARTGAGRKRTAAA